MLISVTEKKKGRKSGSALVRDRAQSDGGLAAGTAAWLSMALIMIYICDIDHAGSFWPSVYKSLQKPLCPRLSQAHGEADEEQRGTTPAGALLVPQILKSKLEEGKCNSMG